MSKNHIIGLTGLAGVGKDTVADLLVAHCGFVKFAFADALRGEVANGFGVDLSFLTDPQKKNAPCGGFSMRRAPVDFRAAVLAHLPGIPRDATGLPTEQWLDAWRSPRQVMQWWGTEYRRLQRPSYWAARLADRMVDAMRNGQHRFVVTDCRYANEVDTIRAINGVIWQIKRPGIELQNTPEGAHSSTTDGSKFEPAFVIDNAHDIAHLQQLVLSEFVASETGIRGLRVTVPA